MHVHYCHGLESGPAGYKVRTMRAWGARVDAPDMGMSLWDPRAPNGTPRHLLRALAHHPPTRWLAAALDGALEGSIATQRRALQEAQAADARADVLVASSWGGAVALALLAEGAWSGPAIVLCPALMLVERWMWPSGPLPHTPRASAALLPRLAQLPAAQRAHITLVHGDHDRTVPLAHSRRIADAAGFRLHVVPNGTHGLGAFTRDGLRACIEATLSPL